MCDNTFENMRSRDIHIRRCEWSHGCKMTKSKSHIKNSKLFNMCGTSPLGSTDSKKLI